MATKLGAAQYATKHGIYTVIASGENVKTLYNIMDGRPIGTLFMKDESAGIQKQED